MPRTIPESTRELCLSLPDTEEFNLDVNNGVNWEEVDSPLESSYRQIALKWMLKALDDLLDKQ